MSCFGGKVSPDLFQNCCNANTLCEFNGNINDLVSEPLYVQKVYDAVLFNLQGMKTVQNQVFTPNIPRNHRIKRVTDVRCKRFFNPTNVEDPRNLRLDLNTTISGATFLQHANGEPIQVVGPDGTYSEKILFADSTECDEKCMGTPLFGTQTICITGNVTVFLELLLCDKCNNEVCFEVCADVTVATCEQPLVLTNFFEICMPSTFNSAFLPRFTEFCNPLCETRLATNNMGRDLCVDSNGTVSGNLIIAVCVSCEKKIVVPVQLCVLSTGFAQVSPQVSAICTTFPSLFPPQIRVEDTLENCGEICECEEENPCGKVRGSCCDCECECEDERCEERPQSRPHGRR